MTLELKAAEFSAKVLDNDKLTVVEVWASWCHNCKRLNPVFKESAVEQGDKADFYQLLADDNMDLVKSLKVMAVPTILYYIHGILVARTAGVSSKKSIHKTIARIAEYTVADAEKNAYRSWINKLFGK